MKSFSSLCVIFIVIAFSFTFTSNDLIALYMYGVFFFFIPSFNT